jgi:tetratricopeptide (TPR) repeat protein
VYSIAKVCAAAILCVAAASAQKQYKDGEYDVYNAVVKDVAAANFTQAIANLDAWTTRFPQSNYDPERQSLYMKSYVAAKQWAKALDKAADLLDKNLDTFFADPRDALQTLYSATVALPMLPDPTDRQAHAGARAARQLLAFDRRPTGVADADWTKLRADLQAPAKAALLYVAMLPGNRALTKQPRDCAAAETAYRKALDEFPESAAVAFNLGSALNCAKKTSEALYAFQRAAVIDPTLGGTRDANQVRSMADNAYTKVHGSDEGLAQLKELAKRSPLPPAGFTVKNAAEIQADKDAAFEAQNPQLALWMKIRGALAAPDGPAYFESQLKNAAVPQLRGTLVEARPACRPKQLVVAPGGPGSGAEILLKLDVALTGKPQAGADFRWEGVPSAFTADPLLLTMDTEAKAIQGLTAAPCAAAPRAAAPRKK